MIRYHNPGLRWEPLDCIWDIAVLSRMVAILESWRGTAYMSGQQQKGVHADCIGFAFGVVDELYRRETPTLDGRSLLPADASMHDRVGAIRTVRTLRKLYMPNTLIRTGRVQPGDLLIVGSAGPGHVYFVGPYPNTLWHCNNGVGVVPTGFALPTTSRLFGVYRIGDKEKWA